MDGLLNRIEDRKLIAAASAFLLLALMVGGVTQLMGSSESGSHHEVREEPADLSVAASGDAIAEKQATESKRVTTVNLDVEVKDVPKAQNKTRWMVEKLNGTVKSVSVRRDDGQTGRMTVRVPESRVSAFLSEAESRWKVNSMDRDSRDVTERYTELELELKNKRQELARLEKMMNSTENVDSLIKIQERMSELRSRIQFLENQLDDLDSRVSYTEIRITYEEPRPITAEFDLRDSVSDSYRGFFSSLRLIVVGIGYLLPFLLIGLSVIYARRFLRQRR